VSRGDLFDTIAARARHDSDQAVATYRQQQAALGERLRVRDETAAHQRGVTREAVAAGGAILLPADDIDLSPHTPVPETTSSATVSADVGAPPHPDPDPDPDPQPDRAGATDFSFGAGWLSDR
jgi:hypothetical protein